MKKQYILLLISTIVITGLFFVMTLSKNKKNELQIENSYIAMPINSTYSFRALCTKKDCTLTYKSSNESIFTVNEEGDISSMGVGEATLFIESEDIKKEATILVTDDEVMITGINIKEDTLELNKNQQYLLEVEVFPNKAVYESLEWISSDTDVITVSD